MTYRTFGDPNIIISLTTQLLGALSKSIAVLATIPPNECAAMITFGGDRFDAVNRNRRICVRMVLLLYGQSL